MINVHWLIYQLIVFIATTIMPENKTNERHFCQFVYFEKYRYRNNLEHYRKTVFFPPIKMVLKQPYKLKYNSMIAGVHVGLTGVLRGKRAQINLMNWPKGLVHIRHHHIMLINILPGKPLTAFIFIRSKLSNSRGGIFFFFDYCPFGCSEGSQLLSSLPLKMHYASPEGSLNQRDWRGD